MMKVRFRLAAVATAIAAVAGFGSLASPADAATPTVPQGVVATAGGTSISVRWAAPTNDGGASVDRYLVQVFGATEGYRGAYTAVAPSTTTTVDGLTAGEQYAFAVYPHNRDGYGAGGASNWATATSALCGTTANCVAVDGATNGPNVLRAQGFLHGAQPLTDIAKITALKPRAWRVSVNDATTNLVRSVAPNTSLILSDFWYGATYNPATGTPAAPWSNWDGYAAWVRSVAASQKALRGPGLWWDVQNEPGPWAYTPSAGLTPQLVLQQFKVAHDAIKAVDPTAHLIGPSLGWFSVTPGGQVPDLATFLDFVATNNLKFDAVSWHEIDTSKEGNPASLTAHVQQVRAEIAARPALAGMQVFVNEYASPSDHTLAGAAAAWIAALERANVDQANRSCWDTPGAGSYSECWTGVLDGLLQPDLRTPRGTWWVHRFYATMTGDRASVASTNRTLSAFATRGTDGSVRVLAGRQVSCLPGTNPWCTSGAAAAAPVNGVVRVAVPGVGTRGVTVERVPATQGAVSAPTLVSSGALQVRNGVVEVPMPSFADGEAFVVTVGSGTTVPARLTA